MTPAQSFWLIGLFGGFSLLLCALSFWYDGRVAKRNNMTIRRLNARIREQAEQLADTREESFTEGWNARVLFDEEVRRVGFSGVRVVERKVN